VLTLNKNKLLDLLIRSLEISGWNVLILSENKPFKLRVYDEEHKGVDVSVFIWNCTHGGGTKRAKNEYRVQLTGQIPQKLPNSVTLLLGWHSGYEVFVGFDINKHAGQNSASPSIQVKEEALIGASAKSFSVYHRGNGEIAIAFRPEFLSDYLFNVNSLHQAGLADVEISLLNDLESVAEEALDMLVDQNRKLIVSSIVRKYRATDFRRRVLAAYEHRCAVCGVQLKLIDAAHIIPVAAPSSNDQTNNGVALCKLHHFAYDRNLISFNERYKIEMSSSETAKLTSENVGGGILDFKNSLRPMILLPSDHRDRPPAIYINESRRIRRWLD
jgi:putative restriction endonuclease